MNRAAMVQHVIAYQGTTLALDEVTAQFRSGTLTAVTGGNGSGKSTLLAVLAGVHPVAAGTVERPAGGIALVRQYWTPERTPPLTVRATVAMGRWPGRRPWRRLTAADQAVVDRALDRMGVADLARRSLVELSGGQRQRVMVARGLAQQAPLLLLDEPTAGADAAAADRIRTALRAEADRGAIVVHVAHDPAAVAVADHHLALAAGRVDHSTGTTGATGATESMVIGRPAPAQVPAT